MDTFIKSQKVARRRPLSGQQGKGYISILEGSSISGRRNFFSGKPEISQRDPLAPAERRDRGPDIVRPRPSRPHASPRSVRYTAPFINFEALRVGWRKISRSFRIRSGIALDNFRDRFGTAFRKQSGKTLSLFNGIANRAKSRAGAFRNRSLSAHDHAGGLPASSSAASVSFKGNLLEPGWLLFIDSVPSRAAALTGKLVGLAKKSPLRLLALLAAPVAFVFAVSAAISLASQPRFPLTGDILLPDETTAQELLLAYVSPELAQSPDDVDSPELPALPVSLETRTYVIRKGDSIATVARKFHLRQDTIISINNIRNASGFKVGLELKIPNMDGITHRVGRGDSLPALAKKYGVDMTKLADTNDLSNASLRAGSDLFIPGAKLAPSALQGFYAVKMIWPARGPISSPFGYRSNPFTGVRTFHAGMDIVVNTGTPVKTIMDGSVSDTGYNGVFGNYIIVTHGEGYQTLYGHLSAVGVKKGQSISQGAVIGRSGNTGYSTGPHLHLGLFKKGTAINPAKLLK